MRTLGAWLAACLLWAWRFTCRYRIHNDPRPALRRAGQPYIYALLHAHQLAAVLLNDEPVLAAMVSRSADGDLLVPALRLRRVRPVRGSSRSQSRDKGGMAAIAELTQLLEARIPALLAVDGPRGPRGVVHRGVLALAQRTGAAIVPVVVVPSRRWLLQRTWDRMQIPQPFSRITMAFAPPIMYTGHEDGGSVAVKQRVTAALRQLEAQYDGHEFQQPQKPAGMDTAAA